MLCGNRPEFAEALAATQRAGLRLTTINWHLTGAEVGYIVDDCDATTLVADAQFADAAVEAKANAPKLRACIAVGGDIPGFERWDDVLAAGGSRRPRRHDARDDDALHVGHDRAPEGRVPARHTADRRVALAELASYDPEQSVHLCTGPWYHAAPLAFSLTHAARRRCARRS